MREAAIISPDPRSDGGGVERMAWIQSRVLQQQGWHTSIVGPGNWPGKWHFRLGVDYLTLSRAATAAARARRPDLIVSNGYLGAGSSGRVPRVHVYHGTMVGDTRAEGPAIPRREHVRRTVAAGLAEAIAGHATRVVAVSHTVAAEAHRYYRVHVDAVIPNGIDTENFAPRDKLQARARLGLGASDKLALFVGRVQQRKGGDLVADAVRQAGYTLVVAGATSVPGAHNLGALGAETLPDAYAAADCLLFPSRYEGCSLVILEALACGLPLITTRVGWMTTLLEAVPDYNALCVEPAAADIVTRLRALSEIDSRRLSADAREFVLEHNSLHSYSQAWQALLSTLPQT